MQSFAKDFQNISSDWLTPRRQAALDCFAALGFPTRALENWKQTNVSPIANTTFTPMVAGDAAGALPWPSTSAAYDLFFVDGALVKTSIPSIQGIHIMSLKEALGKHRDEIEPYLTQIAPYENHAFCALNTALAQEGVYLKIDPHACVEKPIRLIYLTTSSMPSAPGTSAAAHLRTLIVAGEQSEATVMEIYTSTNPTCYLINSVTEIALEPQSKLTHIKLQEEGPESFHVANIWTHQKADSQLRSYSISFGGKITRNDIGVALNGKGAECTLDGLFLGNDAQLVDHHTVVDHAVPHCTSHEYYKGLLTGSSRGVFNGQIIVRPDAQKTDAKQVNRNLLLSKSALVHTKPQLEIYADDVKCAHGATIGQLDENALFYLRSRGIPLAQARATLTQAFTQDLVDLIPIELIRKDISEKVNRWLLQAN